MNKLAQCRVFKAMKTPEGLIAYYRVSTAQQGKSGLDLKVQRAVANAALAAG